MNESDLINIIGNLSQSMLPVQRLISGGAYLVGIIFFFIAIQKLKIIGNFRARSSSQEKMFVPIAYIVAGAALIFLPSMISALSNTAFGANNVLQYASFNRFSIYGAMGIVIRTAGLIWFVRGVVLLAHASQPGIQHGPKGLVFLIAGIMAINFDYTIAMFNTMMHYITSTAITFKSARGY